MIEFFAKDGYAPFEGSEKSAGYDLKACIEEDLKVMPGGSYIIPTGVKWKGEKGTYLQLSIRSGMAAKHQLILTNGVGIIDADYEGEIKLLVTSMSKIPYTISPGERIAQGVIQKYETASKKVRHWGDFENTSVRGEGGLGSTGSKKEVKPVEDWTQRQIISYLKKVGLYVKGLDKEAAIALVKQHQEAEEVTKSLI